MAGNILELNGEGGTNSVVLEDSTFNKIDVKAKVRVVLNKSTATTVTVANTAAGAKVEVDEDSAVTNLIADAAVEVTGGDKVVNVTANVKGVELDKAPTGTVTGEK